MCVGVPSSRRIDSPRAYACSFPPTMMTSVPACTCGTLPDTGASSRDATARPTRERAARIRADRAHLDPHLRRREARDGAVGSGRDALDGLAVGKRGEEDVGGLRDGAWRVAPAQSRVLECLGVAAGARGALDGVPGDEAGGHVPAH